MLDEQTKQPKTVQDPRTLYDLAIYNCSLFGSFKQVIFEDSTQNLVREYTNIEIAREATQLATGLRTLGVEKGDRVIVMLPNCPEVLIAYQAIARAGAVIIPVLPLLKGPEVRYIASNSGAKAIITCAPLLPLLKQALADVPTLHYIVATATTTMTTATTMDTSASATMLAYSDVVAKGADKADHYMYDLDDVSVSPDDTAVILYTSGTTGNPKGVMLSHQSLVSNALGGYGESEDPKAQFGFMQLAILPLAHAFGILISNVVYISGATVVMLPRFDSKAVLAAIERYHIVSFAGVPAMFVALLHAPDADKYDTSSLQYCVSGSAPLPVEVLKGFEQKYHCEIREGYGLSEASAALTGHGADMLRKPGSVGVPIAGVDLRIVDNNDAPLSAGEIGEIVARGPNVMQRYYNMPEETANALRNGWLHTGDMGYLDEDGYLYVVERKKDLIIRGGFNIYPRDVEEVLTAHPAVIEAAVVGVPSERMGEEVKAYVATSTPISADELMAYCREHLANYKTPSQIEFVSALPRNAIGKIDKKELRKHHVN